MWSILYTILAEQIQKTEQAGMDAIKSNDTDPAPPPRLRSLWSWIQGKASTKGRRTKKAFRKVNCAPTAMTRAGARATQRTCYDRSILVKIRDAYNRTHPDQSPIQTRQPAALVQALRDRLSDQCDQEDCWLKLLPSAQMQYLEERIFAPKHPREWLKNPREWLSNYDIINVLRQYEAAYPDFTFLGPSPIDFDKRLPGKRGCVENAICTFRLANYVGPDAKQTHIKKIGLSFNLDEHDEAGSHWVTLYVDLNHGIVFYFDSALNDTPPEIDALVHRILDQARELGLKMTYRKNRIQHQFSNSECGMYSLFFLVTLVTGKWDQRPMSVMTALRRFETKRVPDAVVSRFRNEYFNDPV